MLGLWLHRDTRVYGTAVDEAEEVEARSMSETTWTRVEPEYVPPPEGADVLVTIRRGGKRWVAAAKAMRRSETAMGFFAFPDPDRPGEWLRDVVAYQVFPLPLEDGEVAP